jgi:adenylate kinase family enzyme
LKRILILGSAGAGKSTLARRLAVLLKLEVIHLDRHWWQPGWVPMAKEAWQEKVREFAARQSWIIDGNYLPTLPERLAAADTVIFLDFPRLLCLWRVCKRRFVYRRKTRADLAPGCPEKLDWEFILWIWRFPQATKPKILKLLETTEAECGIYILRSPKEVAGFVANFSS